MDAKQHFQRFAAYNTWANARLFAALADLSENAYRQNLKGYFGSLHRTLNHLLLVDELWLDRLHLGGRPHTKLDTVLVPDFATMRKARARLDAHIETILAQQTHGFYEGLASYQTLSGTPVTQPMAEVLTHLFNHQTHHRGQVHGMLSQLGRTPPELDFIYFSRQQQR